MNSPTVGFGALKSNGSDGALDRPSLARRILINKRNQLFGPALINTIAIPEGLHQRTLLNLNTNQECNRYRDRENGERPPVAETEPKPDKNEQCSRIGR